MLTTIAVSTQPANADVYDNMRTAWFNQITGGRTYNAADPDIAAAAKSITAKADDDWTRLKKAKPFSSTCFDDLTFGKSSADVTKAYARLNEMTQAYWAKGGSLYKSAALRNDIIAGLDWMYAHEYNPGVKEYAN
jgi:hyaluronate lyase